MNIFPCGGIRMVKECYYNREIDTVFSGVFYKDTVLSLISRANSSRVFVYNKYSFEKAEKVFNIFDIQVEVVARPYLIQSFERNFTEKGLSVFFEQSIVPYQEHERLYVVEKLISFACRKPDRNVVICTREYENSPHKPKITFQKIISKYSITLPKNIKVVVGKSDDWLPRAEHVISITSSVLLDAIYNRKYVSILELPKHEYYGQGLFLNSGLMSKEVVFPTNNVCREWTELHVEPYIRNEYLEGGCKEVFNFELSFKNIMRILKANYLHFGGINRDFIRYSIKNMVFFRKYHQIYMEQQRSNKR